MTLAQSLLPNSSRQTIKRFEIGGEEFVQIYWDGLPTGAPWQAWRYDAWDDPQEGESRG